MNKTIKRTVCAFIAILMVLAILPVAAFAKEVSTATTDARKLHTLDTAWKSIESVEKSALNKKASPKDVTLAAYKATVNNPYVDKGSIVWESDNQFAFTVDGMHCAYCYRVRNTKHIPSVNQKIVDVLGTKGSGTAGSKNVLLVGPYYGQDSRFTNQYRNEAQSIANTTGGTLTRLESSSATGPAIASNYTNKGVVIYDSHGIQTGSSSYLCLTTNSGITSTDYLNGWAVSSGSAAFIDGRYIKNHINGTLSNCFVWMAICEGMKKEGYGTTGYALLSAGAAAVYGYSQKVTFSGDRRFEAAFWNEMKKGSTVREAINVMKNTVGYTDPYGSAWPIVMSASDPFPLNPDYYQTVNCDWTLARNSVFKMKSGAYTNAYDGVNGTKVGRVYPGDVVTVQAVYPSGWLKLSCPWTGGVDKIVYVRASEFKFKATQYINAYNGVNGTKVGRVYPNDLVTVIEVYSSGWMKCDCPWTGNTVKTIYIKTSEIY